MKKLLLSCALTLVAGGLSACNSRSASNSPNAFAQAPQQRLQASSVSSFSNKVLDAVAVRARFIMFQNSDGNRDGFLTSGELMYGYDPNGIFTKIDANQDGRVTLTEFQKYKPASTTESYIPTRELLRQQATTMWNMINTDGNPYLIQDEVEAFFSRSSPSPVPTPAPVTSPTTPGNSYGGGYGNGGYGSDPGYGVPYDNRQALQQAIQFFVQTDINLDQKLTFSEYEDGYARQLLSFASKPSQPVYTPPNAYPSATPGYPYPG